MIGDSGSDLLVWERGLWQKGHRHIAGVDEAGIGPLAGPVVAAAIILPPHLHLEKVRDSKALTAAQRSRLEGILREKALAYGIGIADPDEIEKLNIYHAGLLAMRRALSCLATVPDYVLVDARIIPEIPWPQEKIIHGDALSQSIAAASILAKEYRDRLMIGYDRSYPEYGFAKHKGYPTRQHREALREHGPCPIHRISFAGVGR